MIQATWTNPNYQGDEKGKMENQKLKNEIRKMIDILDDKETLEQVTESLRKKMEEMMEVYKSNIKKLVDQMDDFETLRLFNQFTEIICEDKEYSKRMINSGINSKPKRFVIRSGKEE